MDDPAIAPCLSDKLCVVYDPATRNFRNVERRLRAWLRPHKVTRKGEKFSKS